MSEPTRVLLLSNSLTQTGAPKIALDVFRHLSDRTAIHTLALDGGPRRAEFERLGPLRLFSELPDGGSSLARLRRKQTRRAWSREVADWKPDLIYANTVAALPLPKYFDLPAGVPVLLHVHEMETTLRHHVEMDRERFLSWPDHYLTVSEAARASLRAAYPQIPGDKIGLIHEFVDARAFPDTARPPRHPDAPFVVGAAGGPDWRKGTELFVHVARALKRRLDTRKQPVRFVWLGVSDTQGSRQLRLMVERVGLADAIDLLPSTPDARAVFADFDVFAMTSWEDPCPLVVMENMLLRTPVVCFAGGGGAPEQVGETGIVVPDFSPDAMADALAYLAENPEKRRALGEAARARVLAHFTTEVQVPKIAAEIARLTRGGTAVQQRGE